MKIKINKIIVCIRMQPDNSYSLQLNKEIKLWIGT